jgi:hypothetical protein
MLFLQSCTRVLIFLKHLILRGPYPGLGASYSVIAVILLLPPSNDDAERLDEFEED